MQQQVVHQRPEQLRIAAREEAVAHQVDHFAQLRVGLVAVHRPVTLRPEVGDFLRGQSEEEEVLRPDLLADLDVGPVERADGERAVHLELHVPRAGRLLARGRDLLREVGRRIDPLAAADVVVGQEHHAQALAHRRVAIEQVAYRVDQPDDELGHEVAGGRLAAEHESPRRGVAVAAGLQPQVVRDHLQHVQVLALVLVDALDLHVEHRRGVDDDPGLRLHEGGELALVVALDLAPRGAEGGVPCQRLQAAEPVELLDPAAADRVGDELRKARVAQHHPAPRRHAVGLVAELLRPERVKVAQHVLLEELRVQLGDAVDGVASDRREVCHAHVAPAALVDERQAGDARVVAQESDARLVEEAGVDLVDDLEVARQQLGEELQRPALKRLGEQRVVGVGEGLAGDLPGGVPVHPVLVHQQPHQLGHRDRGVGVVQLHRVLLVKTPEGNLLPAHYAHHVLQRAGHEEELLLEAQLLALDRLVVGVEHLGDVLGDDLPVHRAVVVAAVEHGEVEGFRRFGAPQPERVRRVVAVTEDRRVVGNADHGLLRDPARAVAAAVVGVVLGAAAELHFHRPFGTGDVPGGAVAQPLVGSFHLAAVDDVLIEDAELVADAVAQGGDLERGHRVEEAGGEPPQAAVAQARFLLLPEQFREVEPELGDRLLDLRVDAEIDQVVAQVRAEQELGGEVGDRARAFARVGLGGAHPAMQQVVAHQVREREVIVAPGGERRELALNVKQVVEKVALDGLLGEAGAVLLDGCRERKSLRCSGLH